MQKYQRRKRTKEIVKDYSSEKCTKTLRYELNILDLDTNPTYFPSSSITGKFQALVSSKLSITFSIESLTVSLAGGES